MARLIAFLFLIVSPAFANDYASPDLSEYFASLMQPDVPTASCCGSGDAYWADKTDYDADGNLVAIITDTRPDTFKLQDGRVINRPHIDVGTRIPVPASKIRKHPIPNPTDHTMLFVGNGSYVYCYEPVGLF